MKAAELELKSSLRSLFHSKSSTLPDTFQKHSSTKFQLGPPPDTSIRAPLTQLAQIKAHFAACLSLGGELIIFLKFVLLTGTQFSSSLA